MIGLLTQNNVCRDALTALLADIPVVPYRESEHYTALLVTDDTPRPDTSVPLIALGVSVPGAALYIETPVRPDVLGESLKQFCIRQSKKITFENDSFIFRKDQRTLFDKRTQTVLPLTEKESDLLTSLATAFPKALSREDLLAQVWNYHPDVETHTVESHIYALRQKIGADADTFIESTPAGYRLKHP